MRSITITARAAADLLEIWEYIAERNPPAADRMVQRLEGACRKIAELPGTGHRRRDVSDKRYRFWPVRPFLIAYQFDSESVCVIRVLHGRRKFRGLL